MLSYTKTTEHPDPYQTQYLVSTITEPQTPAFAPDL